MKIQLFQFYVSYGNVEKNENKIVDVIATSDMHSL